MNDKWGRTAVSLRMLNGGEPPFGMLVAKLRFDPIFFHC
jgi:hypothetical protein